MIESGLLEATSVVFPPHPVTATITMSLPPDCDLIRRAASKPLSIGRPMSNNTSSGLNLSENGLVVPSEVTLRFPGQADVTKETTAALDEGRAERTGQHFLLALNKNLGMRSPDDSFCPGADDFNHARRSRGRVDRQRCCRHLPQCAALHGVLALSPGRAWAMGSDWYGPGPSC